jgi:hypothetical protein
MTLPVVCFSGGKPAASAQEQHCTCKPAACTCSTAQHSAEQHVTSTCLPTPPLRSKSAMLGGKAPLHVLRDGEEPLVLLLATLGADVNVRDDNGDTPLSCACAHGAWLAVTLCVGATCHSGMVPSLPDADQAWQHDISCNAVQAACAPPPPLHHALVGASVLILHATRECLGTAALLRHAPSTPLPAARLISS